MSHIQLSHPAQVHQVHDAKAFQDAISIADSGDTIVLAKDGDYGDISIVNKSGLRITSKSKQLSIRATLSINGACSEIIIENLNIWNDNHNKKQIVLVGLQSKNIIIRHCILSSMPVSMNTLRDKFAGEPKRWVNGIRVLGDKCKVSNNILVNVKLAIQGNGLETAIHDNVIQYFSDDAIRIQQHDVKIVNNHIYDSVLNHPGETTHHDAIRLIPPENRFAAGELRGINILDNVIRSQNRNTYVPKHMQGVLYGITASDGYFVDLTIKNNSLVLNSNHGISLNGVYNLQLSDNKVIASPSNHMATPSIELYLTRISASSPNSQQWLASKPYSLHYEKNQAPLFNVPDDFYEANELGHNHFAKITHEPAPDKNADIKRSSLSTDAVTNDNDVITATPPPLFLQEKIVIENKTSIIAATTDNTAKSDTSTAVITAHRSVQSSTSAPTLRASVHQVANAEELTRAIRNANPGDTILITHSGNYGNVRITNKSRLRIKSFNTDIAIQASFFIDGSSNIILIENMQLWNNDISRRQIIITGKSTNKILIRNCILSTVRLDRNTMHRRYSGNPQQWINGIRMLGSNGQIISNFMMNLKMAISQTGQNTLVQHNLIQFYAEDAIRASHHGVKILHNNIYDSIAAHPGQSAHKDAIQLIPPVDRYNGGKLYNVEIIGNIILSHSQPPVVPSHQRGIVQGIFGSDGYFINPIISGNTVIVNSDHGITLNGVRNLQLIENRIIDISPHNQFKPGIKLYLTRISQHGQQKWLANRPYSLSMQSNQAPTLNIPGEAYQSSDLGGNQFARRTQDLARGHNAIIIRNNIASNEPVVTDLVTPPLVDARIDTGTGDSADGHAGSAVSVFIITNTEELQRATRIAGAGDTLLFKKSGHYGLVRLSNKTGVRIRAENSDISINANFLIDGLSKNIIIENMNIWFSERNWKPVILTGPETANITIRNCLISSYQVTRNKARIQMTGTPKNWVTGIWLRGRGNEIIDNHIVNVRVGIAINGKNGLMQNNLIQYFTDTGIRAINDNLEIVHNNIYDAISIKPDSRRLATGIQLIPAEDRFNSGVIKNIKVTDNVIQAKNSGSPTADNLQAKLQGISMHDGYVSGMVINSNTIVVNTEYGITINGASGLSLNGNKIFDSKPRDNFIPGIRLYYTRTININGNREQVWHTGRNYSVSYSNNQASVFNVPDVGYDIHDGGGNLFKTVTRNKGRGFDPVIAP